MSTASLPRAWRPAAAFVLLASATPQAIAETGSSDPEACSRTYHAALEKIAGTELAKLEDARERAFKGNPALPGHLIFRAASRQRTEAEMAALREASALARRKGRAAWATDADSRWIADQIRRDLTAYLGQPLSPYLCGGVAAYLDTLRSYAGRIEASPARHTEWMKAQESAAARSLEAALDAMKPAPLPHFAPADRPAPGAIIGLRPAAGIDRTQTRSILDREASGKTAAGPKQTVDPDLPPLSEKPATPLGSDRERIAALASLVAAARSGGFLEDWNGTASEAGGPGTEGRPVLSRLQDLQKLVAGREPPIRDPLVRSRLAATLSDIEALDYLAKAQANGPDPLLGAIGETLDAIAAAHAKACTCAE